MSLGHYKETSMGINLCNEEFLRIKFPAQLATFLTKLVKRTENVEQKSAAKS
jgi:hypothetical protein